MAYVTKETKNRIQKQLKTIMPMSCKWSLSGTGKGRLSLNIWAADVDLIAAVNQYNQRMKQRGYIIPEKPLTYCDLHHFWDIDFGKEWNDILSKAWEAMHDGNWDRSDVQTDYFDVGWYCSINLGVFGRPFEVIEKQAA